MFVSSYVFFSTAESFGVSAHIDSGVVWGGSDVSFSAGSARALVSRYTRFTQSNWRHPP